jgi:hypothetical protein
MAEKEKVITDVDDKGTNSNNAKRTRARIGDLSTICFTGAEKLHRSNNNGFEFFRYYPRPTK